MREKILLLAGLICCGTMSPARALAGAVVPPPQETRVAVPTTDIALAGTFSVELSSAGAVMTETGRFLAAELTTAGFAESASSSAHLTIRLQHLRSTEPRPPGGLPAGIETFVMMGSEGYVLAVTSVATGARVTVGADTDEGLFRGASTVRQLVTSSTGARETALRAQLIRDYPDLPMRAAFLIPSLTYSGGQWRVEASATAALDALSRLKYDTAILDVDPPLSTATWSTFYTALAELRAHASKRFIELVPRVPNLQSQSLYEWRDGWWVKDEPFRLNTTGLAISDETAGRSAGNRVANGGFESALDQSLGNAGPGGDPSGNWFTRGSGGPTLSRDCSVRRSGACSLRVDGSGAGDQSLKQWIPGTHPAGHYLVILHVKTATLSSATDGTYEGPGLEAGFYQNTAAVGIAKSARIRVDSDSRDWGRHAFVVRIPRGLSSNQLLLEVDFPVGTGTAWIDDVDVRRIDGDLRNVLTNATPVRVTSTSGTLYTEGVDYSLTPGTIRSSYVDDPTPTVITRLSGSRIPAGGALLISYDKGLFTDVEDPWGDSDARVGQATEQSMNLCGSALFDQLYGPTINRMLDDSAVNALYLVSDELRGLNRSGACHDATGNPLASNAEVLASFLERIAQLARTRRPGIRLYMWDDTLSPLHSGGMPTYQVDVGIPGKTDLGGRPGATFCALDPSAPSCIGERVSTNVGPEIQMLTWFNSPNTFFRKIGALRFYAARGHDGLATATTYGQSCADAERSVRDFAAMAAGLPSVRGLLRDKWDMDSASCKPTTLKATLGWNLEYEQVYYEPFEFQLPDSSPDLYFKSGRPLSAYSLSGASWTSDATCIDRYARYQRSYAAGEQPVDAGGICVAATGGSVLLPSLAVDASASYRFMLDAVAQPAVPGTVRFVWTDVRGATRTQDFPVTLGGNGGQAQRAEVEAPATPTASMPGSTLRVQVLSGAQVKLDNFVLWRSRPGCPQGRVAADAPTVSVPIAAGAQTFSARLQVRNERGCEELKVLGIDSSDGFTSTTTFPVVAIGRDPSWSEIVVTGSPPAAGSSRTVQLRLAGSGAATIPVVLQFVADTGSPPPSGTIGTPGRPTLTP